MDDKVEEFEAALATVGGLLATIGGEQGLELELDETGTCGFELPNKVPVMVTVPEPGQRLVICAPIAPMPDDMDARYSVCIAVLQRNMLEQAVSDGAIGIDQDSGLLVFVIGQDIAGLDAAKLGSLLEQAYGAVLELREALEFDPDAVKSDELTIEPPMMIKA